MRGFWSRNGTTMLVAMVTAAVTAAGPTLAASVTEGLNADQVDGRHAVGPGTSPATRAGKLVATNSQGYLPNNIITKAPDANKLDGLESAAFLRTTAKAANANKLDNRDSTAFWQKSEPVDAATLGGAAANGLIRVASSQSSATTTITADENYHDYGDALTITAPTAGHVLVTSATGITEASECTGGCWVAAVINHVEADNPSNPSMDSAAPGWADVTVTAVFEVAAGEHTFQTKLGRQSTGGGTVQGFWGNMTAVFSPFDATGQ